MKQLARIVAVLALLMHSAVFAATRIEHWVAPSGARVYFVEIRALPILDVNVDFAAGSAYDPADKSGLASLARSLMDAGAANMDEEAIAGKLVDIGAKLSGATDSDRSGLALRTLSTKPERDAAVEILRAVLHQPSYPEPIVERERARSIAAIQEGDTRPDTIAGKRFSEAIFPGHPYGRSATAQSVARIQRADLVAFHRTHFSARGAVVSIVGDLSRAEAEQIAQRLTAGLPEGQVAESLAPPAMPQRALVKVDHPAAQCHVYLGMPGMRRGDPDYFPLLVGNYVLGGGGFVSRLMQEVREKRGFAYSVYSYFAPMQQPGPFQIGLQTKREQVDEALAVVESTLADFLRDGPSEDEVARARQNLINGFVLRLDSNRKILEYVAMIGFYGLPLDYLEDYPRQVERVTVEQIREAFNRRVRPENMVTVVVGGGVS